VRDAGTGSDGVDVGYDVPLERLRRRDAAPDDPDDEDGAVGPEASGGARRRA
jgi:hypothetical protein